MKVYLNYLWKKQSFFPSILLGIWINPFYIIRKGLLDGVREISLHLKGGKLLDLGCGSKPYEDIFEVDEYTGVDIEVSGHDHSSSRIDKFYDGKVIPFRDHHFDSVFSSEVFEHVFNLESCWMK